MNNFIRTFCIIAHIDHGKTTLVDRFIEICRNIKLSKNCILDTLNIEKEKGITIKSHCITLNYTYLNKNYIFNIIDTPGHSDFSFELYNKLYACNFGILLIDVLQGIEAQTIAIYKLAKKINLDLIIVLNKIDLLIFEKDEHINKLLNDLIVVLDKDININSILKISGKTGYGVKTLIKKIIEKYTYKNFCNTNLITYSFFIGTILSISYENFIGYIVTIIVNNGFIKKNEIVFVNDININKVIKLKIFNLGINNPERIYINELNSNEVGFLIFKEKFINLEVGTIISTNKDINNIKIERNLQIKKETNKLQHSLFTEIYPCNEKDIFLLEKYLNYLNLNNEFLLKPCISPYLGSGFNCNFLGSFYLDIILNRLINEYKVDVITTTTICLYKILLKNKEIIHINNPINWPKIELIEKIYEQIYKILILTKKEFINDIINLCKISRGYLKVYKTIFFTKENYTFITCFIPLEEIIDNFFSKLKSITKGFFSYSYYFQKYVESDIIKVSLKINNKLIENLSYIIHKSKVFEKIKSFSTKINSLFKKQLFDMKISICIQNKIIKSFTIKAKKKNVLEKCSGGDRTRKEKLLKNQKNGKKKLKNIHKMTNINRKNFVLTRNTLINILMKKN